MSLEDLKRAWNEFAEQHKEQVGVYHLLKQEFDFKENSVTIHLSNPIEEPLLQTIKISLTSHLREKLKNNDISITGQLKETQAHKIAYTNKEKFDHLVVKNPILKELKERLDLDTDY